MTDQTPIVPPQYEIFNTPEVPRRNFNKFLLKSIFIIIICIFILGFIVSHIWLIVTTYHYYCHLYKKLLKSFDVDSNEKKINNLKYHVNVIEKSINATVNATIIAFNNNMKTIAHEWCCGYIKLLLLKYITFH